MYERTNYRSDQWPDECTNEDRTKAIILFHINGLILLSSPVFYTTGLWRTHDDSMYRAITVSRGKILHFRKRFIPTLLAIATVSPKQMVIDCFIYIAKAVFVVFFATASLTKVNEVIVNSAVENVKTSSQRSVWNTNANGSNSIINHRQRAGSAGRQPSAAAMHPAPTRKRSCLWRRSGFWDGRLTRHFASIIPACILCTPTSLLLPALWPRHDGLLAEIWIKPKNCIIDWVMVSRPTRHRIGHFGNVLSSQSLGLVLRKLNLTQQKQATQKQNDLS